jgi:hypothetical protein
MPSNSSGCVPRAEVGRLRRGHYLATAVLFLLVACGDGGSGPDDPPAVTSLVPVSGNGQSGEAGTTLADSLVVRATDSKGQAIPGVTVTWTIQSGGGSVPASTVTGSTGLASVQWLLGTTPAPARSRGGRPQHDLSATIRPGEITT